MNGIINIGKVEEWKTNLMSLAILFHFLRAQHVSDINISIIRNLRLCCWITTSVVLFSVRCVLEIWCGWFWVVSVLQTEVQLQPATRTLLRQPIRGYPPACELRSILTTNVCWTVHHCNSWRIKDQLDVTYYFISLLTCSTCFGH